MTSREIASLEDFTKTYKKPEMVDYKKASNWFPVYPSEKLAGLVADLMADGHLQGFPKWRFDYTSNSIEELERFQKIVFDLFGIESKIRKCTTNKYGTMNVGVNCQQLARLLMLCGVPTGSKTEKTFLIPDWIIENKSCFREFVKRYFSCEGCVDLDGAIEIQLYKNINLVSGGLLFMDQIRSGLKKFFDIKTTVPFLGGWVNKRKNKADSKAIRLKIRNEKGLLDFYKEIGFEDKNKMEKLKKVIEKKGII